MQKQQGRPNEIPGTLPFAQDTRVRDYDADSVEWFHGALVWVHRVFEHFRTSFLESTYEAAAETGRWDRAALECDLGRPRLPRSLRTIERRA